jgi:GNAT superfamily N-acetyltransferase
VTAPSPMRANATDAQAVAALIAEAFQSLAVAAWLVPEPAERAQVLYANFQIHVEHAAAHGEIWTVPDRAAATVWFPSDSVPPPVIPAYERRLAAACGRHVDRFRVLDEYFDRHHPHEPHHHLAFLAVAPHRQEAGLGSMLLTHYHARLDQTGTPGYLEASSERSRALYLRHGYADLGAPFTLPGGPPFWPMWRAPR